MNRALAWLLGLANAHAGRSVYSREFYAVKDRLLWRFGRNVGEDVQRIVHECYGRYFEGCKGEYCAKCGGTGIYQTRLVLLQRWELGGRIFHRPDRAVWGEGWIPTIEGRITHDGIDERAAAEARLWLTLLFAPALFWKILRGSRYLHLSWRYPMLALQAFVFEARGKLPYRRHCWCGRTFYTRTGRQICGSCRNAPAVPDDLPF